jgi:hypothetical protein
VESIPERAHGEPTIQHRQGHHRGDSPADGAAITLHSVLTVLWWLVCSQLARAPCGRSCSTPTGSLAMISMLAQVASNSGAHDWHVPAAGLLLGEDFYI